MYYFFFYIGVAGVCAIKDEEPSLEEKITAYEATGRLQDAFSCYERISQREDCSLEFYQVFIYLFFIYPKYVLYYFKLLFYAGNASLSFEFRSASGSTYYV